MPNKPVNTGKSFRVALNPRNPEACSWYDDKTGVNLSLGYRMQTNKKTDEREPIEGTGPISADLGNYTEDTLRSVYEGIKAGLLIVSEGDLPDSIQVKEIASYNSPRSRWNKEKEFGSFEEQEKAALDNWDRAIRERSKGETKIAAS